MLTPNAFFASLALALSASSAAPSLPLSATASQPVSSMTAQEAFASLEGEWKGTLTYRDYQSQTLESIPVAVTMETQPDGETMVQRYDYTDPGFQVYITNLITVKDGVLAGATARAGRAFETYEKSIAVTEQAGTNEWIVTLDDEAKDDNRPARVRETMTRSQSTLKVLKEVDYLDDEVEGWIFRNEITLTAAQ